MANNKNDATLDNPITPQSKNLSDEIFPATEMEMKIQNQ